MMSETTTKATKKSGRGELFDTIIVIIEALVIAVLFRTFLYQPFSIPTASMQQTLMIGDYFVASKWAWGFGPYSFPVPLPFNGRFLQFTEPQRGDIAVFHNISDEDYIKRIIGMPGDTVQVKAGRLFINGVIVEREFVGTAVDNNDHGQKIEMQVYRETLPNGVVHTIQEISDNVGDGKEPDNTKIYVVPDGHYFMMGDNRDRSQDSRYLSAVGYVPATSLIGKAEARFFSITDNIAPWKIWEWPANVRWDRMFQSVYR